MFFNYEDSLYKITQNWFWILAVENIHYAKDTITLNMSYKSNVTK